MLTDAALKCLKQKAKMYKVTDRDGMYVRVAPTGGVSFRLDYRLNGRRETVHLGKYARDGISLSRARELRLDAKRMIALKTCAGNSRYLLPSRYDADAPMSRATFNRVTYAVVEQAKKEGLPLEPFTVHDLRRTGSTLLNEPGFNRDWIEKCLAHENGCSTSITMSGRVASRRYVPEAAA